MESRPDRAKHRLKRRRRYRHKVLGTQERPRLLVFRSLKHIYAQAMDDAKGVVLASASSLDPEVRKQIKNGGNVSAAKVVGEIVATRLVDKGVKIATFDRGGYLYHGRVQAVADGAREKGLKI